MKNNTKNKLALGKLDTKIDKVVTSETVIDLDIDALSCFPNHPFKPYDNEKMQKLKNSIETVGLLSPIVVNRTDKTGQFIIISGHNRVEAFRQLGKNRIPSSIKDVDEETAAIMMVDTNFNQREELLPSEKAFAYKIKVEANKRKAGRPEKNERHGVTHFKTSDKIGEESGESGRQVLRYIRLTELLPELLVKVDTGNIGFIPAVEISYLTKEQQNCVLEILNAEGIKPTKIQAAELKKRSQEKKLGENEIRAILISAKREKFSDWKAHNKFKSLLPQELRQEITPEKADEILEEAMIYWLEKYRYKFK